MAEVLARDEAALPDVVDDLDRTDASPSVVPTLDRTTAMLAGGGPTSDLFGVGHVGVGGSPHAYRASRGLIGPGRPHRGAPVGVAVRSATAAVVWDGIRNNRSKSLYLKVFGPTGSPRSAGDVRPGRGCWRPGVRKR